MRKLTKFVLLGGLAYGAKALYDSWRASQGAAGSGESGSGESGSGGSGARRAGSVGYDTPTGTDPAAKYARPGYEDKSFGQAVNSDQRLVDELVDETGGDMERAEARFRTESAGSPAIARQEHDRD